jgi:hypothetical protein
MPDAPHPSFADDPISRRRAIGLAGGAVLGTLLGGGGSPPAPTPAPGHVEITTKQGRAPTRAPQARSV